MGFTAAIYCLCDEILRALAKFKDIAEVYTNICMDPNWTAYIHEEI